MVFADFREQVVDVPPDVAARCLDTGDNLRDDLQPGIDLDVSEAVAHGMANIVMRAILEPQRKQSERILQRVLIPERYGAEEPSDG